jgi:hypothetical protein
MRRLAVLGYWNFENVAPPPRMVATAFACLVALTLLASCVEMSRIRRGAVARRTLDDFETAPERRSPRYRMLPESSPPSSTLDYRQVPASRAGTDGHALHLRYTLDPTAIEATPVGLGIALANLDASDYDHLELWIRGDRGEGYAPDVRIGFRRPRTGRADLTETGSWLVTGVTGEWRRVLVPLNAMAGIHHWHDLRELFILVEPRGRGAPETRRAGGYFIDDITLVRTGERGPSVHDPVVPGRKQAWLAAVGGEKAAQGLIRARLVGWPQRFLVPRQELPGGDDAFLRRLARDTWRGLDALTDRGNGLPVDHVVLARSAGPPPGGRVADYTSVTNIGLHMIAIAAARDLAFLSETDAVARLTTLLDTLERLETHDGFFFNYYDTTTLERTSNFLSFVDSAWLTAGLMVTRQSFATLRERCSRLIAAGDYRTFYDDVVQQMSHGYYVNVPVRSEYHYGLLYTEARLGSLIAIGKGDAPEEHWYRLGRTPPPQGWQSQPPRHRRLKTLRGQHFRGGYYEWQNLAYIPSWGGSMFEALMPTLVLDESRYAPRSLGRNGATHVAIQQRYALDVLGYPVWGVSPSASPRGGYGEYGIAVLGVLGYDAGAVSPHASALALRVAPEAAIDNLRRLAARYDVYGDFGFYDAVEPRSGVVAHQYLALDQAMLFIAVANHLGSSGVSQRFASDPIVQRVLPLLGAEDFFD